MRRGVDETKENLDDQPWLSEVEVLWFGGQERWRFQVSLLHSVVTHPQPGLALHSGPPAGPQGI